MKRQVNSSNGGAAIIPPIQSLPHFIAGVGISPVTAWRFEKRGWLTTINIAGRRYVTAEAAEEFVRRAQAGEFARNHPTPKRTASVLP